MRHSKNDLLTGTLTITSGERPYQMMDLAGICNHLRSLGIPGDAEITGIDYRYEIGEPCRIGVEWQMPRLHVRAGERAQSAEKRERPAETRVQTRPLPRVAA